MGQHFVTEMTEPTPTQRVEAARVARPDTYIDEYVTADFAREIARELEEALAASKAICETNHKLALANVTMETERDELREKLGVTESEWAAHLDRMEAKWDTERDELRAKLAAAERERDEARANFAKAEAWNNLTHLQITNLQSLVKDQDSDLAAALADNATLREELEQAAQLIDAKIDRKSALGYIHTQFPATVGNIPLHDYFGALGATLVNIAGVLSTPHPGANTAYERTR